MEYWIWLTQLDGVGPVIAKSLLENFKSPEEIYKASKDELLSVHGIGEKVASKIREDKSLAKA